MKLTDNFWTSGTNLNYPVQYKWCSGGTFYSGMPWGSGQPNNYQGNEYCVEITFTPNDATTNVRLNDYVCSNTRHFICEVSFFHCIESI
jgi:hypothetical protein